MERRIAQVREVLEFNRFVEQYNEAVRLTNQGKHKEALAVLEPLVRTTKNPDQARQAQDMLERIKALVRK